MAVVTSGTVTQSSDAKTLTFTDSSTGIVGLVSRTLVIKDPNDNVLATINMGASLTATYTITQDQYLKFEETIVDNSGSYPLEIDYLSTAFFQLAFTPVAAKLDCCCGTETCLDVYKALISAEAAQNFALRGLGSLAQSSITDANTLLTNTCGC